MATKKQLNELGVANLSKSVNFSFDYNNKHYSITKYNGKKKYYLYVNGEKRPSYENINELIEAIKNGKE